MTPDNAIDTLNDLIETCRDGEYGFRLSAEHAKSPDLRRIFTERAEQCGHAARELQSHVAQLGGRPDEGGSASGALHRGWVSVRAKLTGYTDRAMLEECERGEDVAVARYRKAMEQPLPEAVKTTVAAQYLGAKRNHDLIRDLRDRFQAQG